MEVSFLNNTYYVILLPGLGGPEGREGAISILVEVGNGGCEQHAENRKGAGPDRVQSRACGVSWAGEATTPLQGFAESHQPLGQCDRAHPITIPFMASAASPLGAWRTSGNEMGSSALTVASEGREREGSLEPLQSINLGQAPQPWVTGPKRPRLGVNA